MVNKLIRKKFDGFAKSGILIGKRKWLGVLQSCLPLIKASLSFALKVLFTVAITYTNCLSLRINLHCKNRIYPSGLKSLMMVF